MNIVNLLEKAVEAHASDIFIVAGLPISYRANGSIHHENEEKLMPPQTKKYLEEIYELAGNRDINILEEKGDDDFSFALPGISRFRVSSYKQRGALSAVVRIITFDLPQPELIGIPQQIIDFSKLSKGLVLITGPAGSGKSTTLACIINEINKTQEKHIITLEDPIEFLHRHQKSIVSQREVKVDTKSYVVALRASLRQSPDVILLGEMRDYETIDVTMTAAETGHLVFSTLHTIGAANTIDRIIDVFPASQQRQIAVQLSMVLQAIVTQQLVPDINGELIPVFEIMTVTPAIRNMIRDHKIPQIDGILYASNKPDMISTDMSLLNLYKEGKITKETALNYATNEEMLKKVHEGFLEQLVELIRQAFDNKLDVKTINMEEQLKKAYLVLKGKQTISLDTYYRGTYDIETSRLFDISDIQKKYISLIGRIGHDTIEHQIERIKDGNYILVDDDSATGKTIREVMSNLPERINIEQIYLLASMLNEKIFDIVDLRDFIIGVQNGGLVVRLPNREVARSPYMLPYVSLKTRATISATKELKTSIRLWQMNKEFYKKIGAIFITILIFYKYFSLYSCKAFEIWSGQDVSFEPHGIPFSI